MTRKNKPAVADFDKAYENYLEQRALDPSLLSDSLRSLSTPANGPTDAAVQLFGLTGIRPAVTEDSIVNVFGSHGKVQSVRMGVKSGVRTGYAIILVRDFPNTKSAQKSVLKAIRDLGCPNIRFSIPAQKVQKAVTNSMPRAGLELAAPIVTKAAGRDLSVSPTPRGQAAKPSASAQTVAPQAIKEAVPVEASLIDLGDDMESTACTVPPLSFTSSSSSADICTPPTLLIDLDDGDDGPPPLVRTEPLPANAGSLETDLAQLRAALGELGEPDFQAHSDTILGLILMLPSKQRLRCLFSSKYLRLKARLALAMLVTEVDV